MARRLVSHVEFSKNEKGIHIIIIELLGGSSPVGGLLTSHRATRMILLESGPAFCSLASINKCDLPYNFHRGT